MCAGGPGSIPGADKFVSGFPPSGHVNEEELDSSWMTTTEDWGVKAHRLEMTMQPEAQTTTRGFLAVSAGALEMVNRYPRRLRRVLTFLLYRP